MAAVAAVLLYLAQVMPTVRLSLIAAAGIAGAVVTAQYGPVWGIMSFAAAALISLFTAPVSDWMYIAFFGWYPAVKSWIERLDRRFEWPLKLAAFNAAFFVLWFLLPAVLAEMLPKLAGLFWVLFLGGNAAFVVYDFALSGLLRVLIQNLLPKIRKN